MWIFSKQKKEFKLFEVSETLSNFKAPFALVTTPINLKEERVRFFNSDKYEPVFKYNLLPTDNDEILNKLSGVERIVDVDPRISDLYLKIIEEKHITNELYKSIGNNELVTKYSIKRFGFPTQKLFNNSVLVLKNMISNYNLKPVEFKNSSKKANALEIKEVSEYFLKEYGFDDFKVIFSSRETSGVRVGVKDKEVVLGNKNIEKTNFDLRKLVVHEIGTHLFRYLNGLETKIPALYIGGHENSLIEEGFASYNEEYMGLLSPHGLKRKARLTYAIFIGKDLSFRQLYNVIRGFLPKEDSFRYCLRVKRGLGDMSAPGIYSKGVVYFKGYRRVRKAIANDSSIHKKLFAGKINLNQVSWVDDGLIPKPKLVIEPERFNKAFEKLGI